MSSAASFAGGVRRAGTVPMRMPMPVGKTAGAGVAADVMLQTMDANKGRPGEVSLIIQYLANWLLQKVYGQPRPPFVQAMIDGKVMSLSNKAEVDKLIRTMLVVVESPSSPDPVRIQDGAPKDLSSASYMIEVAGDRVGAYTDILNGYFGLDAPFEMDPKKENPFDEATVRAILNGARSGLGGPSIVTQQLIYGNGMGAAFGPSAPLPLMFQPNMALGAAGGGGAAKVAGDGSVETQYVPSEPRMQTVQSTTSTCGFERKTEDGGEIPFWRCERTNQRGISKCTLMRLEKKTQKLYPVNCEQNFTNVLTGYDVVKSTTTDENGNTIVRNTITPEVQTYGSVRRITGKAVDPIQYRELPSAVVPYPQTNGNVPSGGTPPVAPMLGFTTNPWRQQGHDLGGGSSVPQQLSATANGQTTPLAKAAGGAKRPQAAAPTQVAKSNAATAPKAPAATAATAATATAPKAAGAAASAPKGVAAAPKTAGAASVPAKPAAPKAAGAAASASKSASAHGVRLPDEKLLVSMQGGLTQQDLQRLSLGLPAGVVPRPTIYNNLLPARNPGEISVYRMTPGYGVMSENVDPTRWREEGYPFPVQYQAYAELDGDASYLQWLISLEYELRDIYPQYHEHTYDPAFDTIATVQTAILATLGMLETPVSPNAVPEWQKITEKEHEKLFRGWDVYKERMARDREAQSLLLFARTHGMPNSPLKGRYTAVPPEGMVDVIAPQGERNALENLRILYDQVVGAAYGGVDGSRIPVSYRGVFDPQRASAVAQAVAAKAQGIPVDQAAPVTFRRSPWNEMNANTVGVVEDDLLSLLSRLQSDPRFSYAINSSHPVFAPTVNALMSRDTRTFLSDTLCKYLEAFALDSSEQAQPLHLLARRRDAYLKAQRIDVPSMGVDAAAFPGAGWKPIFQQPPRRQSPLVAPGGPIPIASRFDSFYRRPRFGSQRAPSRRSASLRGGGFAPPPPPPPSAFMPGRPLYR